MLLRLQVYPSVVRYAAVYHSNFIPQTEYGNAFVSHDNEDLYLTAVSGEYDSYKLVVSKLSEKQELQSQIMAETELLDYWGIPQPNDIQVKWNERRATMLINFMDAHTNIYLQQGH